MAKFPGFVGPSYASQSVLAAGEVCMNFYPEVIESGGKTRAALYPTPGLPDFATLTAGPCRGLVGDRTRCFAVGGGALNELDSAGAVIDRGAVADDGFPATLCSSGDAGEELFVTAGDSGYILDLATDTLTLEVTDVTMGGQVDGFFIALDGHTSTLKISELLDGKTWDSSQIAQRNSASDPWVALLVAGREIFLFGERTGEAFYNKGTSPFPFAQRPGSVFEVGIEAPWSLAKFGGSMAWLGKSDQGSGIVYWMNGYTPNRISNHAVEWAIQQYRDTYKDAGGVSGAIGWSYESQGHQFYVLTFPLPGKTWVYDAATNQWHERGLWDPDEGDFVAYRPRYHAEMFNRNIVGDGSSTGVYTFSTTTYTDVDGEILRRMRRSPHLAQENRRFTVDAFEIEADRGVGLTTGQGADPLLMLRYSRNGGKTWGTERTRSLGAIGEYGQRIRWDRCGNGRDWVFEVSCSDPVPVRLLDAYLEAS